MPATRKAGIISRIKSISCLSTIRPTEQACLKKKLSRPWTWISPSRKGNCRPFTSSTAATYITCSHRNSKNNSRRPEKKGASLAALGGEWLAVSDYTRASDQLFFYDIQNGGQRLVYSEKITGEIQFISAGAWQNTRGFWTGVKQERDGQERFDGPVLGKARWPKLNCCSCRWRCC